MIKDIQPKQGGVMLEAEVTEKGIVREFQKFGKPGRVCTARIKDATGECNLSLWNEQIDQVNAGDKIKITDGYSNEWQGEIQVSTGRNGTLEVVAGTPAKASDSDKTENVQDSESTEIKEDIIE